MRNRSRARECAVQFLYQCELNGGADLRKGDLDAFLKENGETAEVRRFAEGLVRGYWEHRETIDRRIEEISQNWRLDRMAAIDRNIIRLGAYELMFRDDVPALVSINEAIEMAKKFSTQKSGRFVNGVLDSLRKKYASHKPCGRNQQPKVPTEP